MKFKPFNLEDAKAGVPVCNKKGRPVRIVAYDCAGDYPVVGLLRTESEDGDNIELPKTYTNEGKFYSSPDTDVEEDLVHPLNEKTFYIGIFYDTVNDVYYTDGCGMFQHEKAARDMYKSVKDFYDVVPVTIYI